MRVAESATKMGHAKASADHFHPTTIEPKMQREKKVTSIFSKLSLKASAREMSYNLMWQTIYEAVMKVQKKSEMKIMIRGK